MYFVNFDREFWRWNFNNAIGNSVNGIKIGKKIDERRLINPIANIDYTQNNYQTTKNVMGKKPQKRNETKFPSEFKAQITLTVSIR